MHEGYFEGVLQLRNPNQALVDFVAREIKKERIYVSKSVETKAGIDLFLSSQKFIRQLARKLPKNFQGCLKSNRKLFTRKRQTSKNIYRVCVMFRLPNFQKGQIVHIRGGRYESTSNFRQSNAAKCYNNEKEKLSI